MGRIGVDLSVANLTKDGIYTGKVIKLDYQVKTGDKWNQEGTSNVSFDDFAASPDPARKRLHYTISIPGQGNHFNDLYMKESALGFTQAFMKACGVEYDKTGFDPDDAIGKDVQVEVTTSEDDEFGFQNNFKYSKV
jgi:hypothetical protein